MVCMFVSESFPNMKPERIAQSSHVFMTHNDPDTEKEYCARMIYTSLAHRQSRRFTGSLWKHCSLDALLQGRKKKKSVSRGGEERPQQAETWTAADSYGLAQQRYKLEPVLQGLESVISEFYVLILHIFAHPWTYLQQPT